MKSSFTKQQAFASSLPGLPAIIVTRSPHRLISIFLPILFLSVSFSAQAQIAAWDFSTLPGGTNNFGPSPYSVTTSDANVVTGGLMRGAGVTVSGTGATAGWGGNGFDGAANLAAATSANNYVSFSMTTNSGYALSLSNIGAYNIRLSGSGPTMGQWQYQVGSGAFVNIGSAISWGSNITAAGNAQTAIDLTGVTDLQNIPASTTITFRIVSWSATGSGGNWYFNDLSNSVTEDLVVNGSLFVCSAPPSADPPLTAVACASVGAEIVGNPTGGTTPYTHLWTNLGTGSAFGVSLLDETTATVTASAMNAGTIDLRYRVTDNTGCTGSKDVTVTVNPSPTGTLTEMDMSGTANNDNIICNGGTATFTATPGFDYYDFTVNGFDMPFAQSGISNVLVTPPPSLTDGDDVGVIVTDGNGCKATFYTPTMTVYDLPTPDILAQTNIDCYGNNTGFVTVSGGTMYSLNGGAFQPSGTFSGLTAGSYTVTVKNVNGCTADQPVTITQPTAPLTASISAQTDVECFGQATGSVTVSGADGTAPYMYSFNGGPYGPSGTFSGYAAGSYTVTTKDAHNCTVDQPIMIMQPDMLSATVTPTHLACFGVSTGQINISSATGGSGPYEYSIDGGMNWQNSTSFTSLSAGTYNVQIRDAVSCVVTLNAALIITQPTALVATTVSDNVSCNGGSDGAATVNVTGGTGGYSYDWDGTPSGDGSATINTLVAGTYTVTVTDANGCVTSTSVMINEPAVLSASVASTDVTCFNASDGTITVNGASGGYGSFEYSINGGTNWQGNNAFAGLAPGTYNVRVRDAAHTACFVTLNAALEITGPDVLDAYLSYSNIGCFNASNGTINITLPVGGSFMYEYSIDGGSSWHGSGSFSSLPPGNYDVQMRDALYTTCVKALDVLTITQPNILNATLASSDVSCFGNSDGSITFSNPTGGYLGNYQYSIDGGMSWQVSGSFTGLAPNAYIVQISDANIASCVVTLNNALTIDQPDILNAMVASTNTSCFGTSDGSISITSPTGGYGSFEYSIDGGTNWQGSGSFMGLASGFYNVKIRDAAHTACFVTLNGALEITQPSVLSASIASTNVTCFNASDATITINGASGGYGTYEYSIDGGTNWQSSNAFAGLAPGTYNVQIRDAAHTACFVTLNGALEITQPSVLSASIASTNVTCFNASDATITINGASGGYGTYEYSIDGGTNWQGSNAFAGLVPGTYNVQVRDAAHTTCFVTLNGALEITQPAVLSASIASANVTCFNASDATITINGASGGYGSFEYSIDGGANWQGSNAFAGLAPGTYNVQVRDAAHIACFVTLNGALEITQPAILDAYVSYSNIGCYNASNGIINFTLPTGGYGTYEYSINGGGSWQISGSFPGLPPGDYNIQIRDAAHPACVKVLYSLLTITQPGELSATVVFSNVTCFNAADGSITFSNPTGGYLGNFEYSINGGMTWQGSSSFMGLSPGTYIAQIRDANIPSCFVTLNNAVEITQPAILNATVASTNPSCFGTPDGTISITLPTGGYGTFEYSVDGGTTWQPGGSYTGLASGFYNVQIRDAAHTACIVTLNGALNVMQPAILNATVASTNLSCFGTLDGTISITLPTGGYGSFEYSVDGGTTWQTGGSYTGLASGFYNVQIRDAAHTTCVVTLNAALEITQPAILNATLASTDLSCYQSNDGSITISSPTGGYGNYEYSINGGMTWQGSGSFSPLLPGSYNVQMRDADHMACVITLNPAVAIVEPAQVFVAPITGSNLIYVATSTQLMNATPLMGGSAVWESSMPTKATVDQTGFVFGLMTGTTIISYTVTDIHNCTNSTTFTVNVSTPVINIGVYNYVNAAPAGNKLKIKINPIIQVVNAQYSSGTFTLRTATSNGITGLTVLSGLDYPNPYGYQLIGSSLNNAGYDYYVFNFENFNLVNWTANSFIDALTIGYNCAGNATFEIVQNYAAPPLFGNFYQELNGAGAQNQITPATATSAVALNLSTTQIEQWCSSLGSIDLTVTNGWPSYSYDWSNDGPDAPDDDLQDVNNLTAGAYTVTVTDANGCTAVNSTAILYLPVTNTTQNTHYATIQAAINAANTGDNLNICAGTYYEALNVNKSLTISGAGNGSNPATNTVLSPSIACTGVGITIAAPNVTVQNMYLTGYQSAILINGVNNPTITNLGLVDYCLYGINLGGNNQNINITQTTIQRTNFLAGTIGIRAGTANAVNMMMIDGCSITGNTQGITVFQATTPVAFDDITIQNSTISNNTLKGMYFEKLSNALFSNLIMDNNGTDASYGNNNGIDVNLKYNSYSNITIQNCEITNSGSIGTATDPQAPAAIAIKARDDSPGYNAIPASLSNVLIKNNKITGPRNGIRIGEYGKINGSPSNVTIEGNDLSHAFAHKALITRSNQDVEVKCNWHGTNDLLAIQTTFATAGSGQINLNTVLNSGAGAGPGFVPTGSCVCPSGNLVTNSTAMTTHCSIQDAIDAATDGDVLVVGPGTYIENIVVDKEVSILGPNTAINPCSGGRVPEAIVLPATAAIASGEIFHVEASNVTISGFNINGDNSSITSGFSSTNGADIDAAEGITVYETGVNNLTVTNNIIENLSYFAVTLYDYPAGVPSTGHLIANNKIQNLGTYDAGSTIAFWGGGVLLYNNQYAEVRENCMDNVRMGVQTGNFYRTDPGSSALIDGNTMTNVRRTGIFHNLHYASASPYTISGNTITGASHASETKWDGILLSSLSVPSTTSGNDITATSVAQASSGIEVWNVKSSSPAVISGGTVTGVTTGVFVNNFDGYASNATDGAHATISGISINPKSSGTGIRLYDNPASTHANVQASVGVGVTINNGTNGLVVENVSASVPSLGNVAFAGQTGNYITLINNANDINATSATFEGNTGAMASLTQNFAIEDKILHKIDDGALGFVLVKANHDFVTINSFSAPATPVALVQRGVDAASPGFTVNVNSGTYTNAININKELKMYGLNSGISPINGIRLSEATLATPSGTMLQVNTTDPVEIRGFRLANTGGPYDYSVSAAVGTTVAMEKNFFDNSIGVYIPNAVTTTIADNLCTFSSGADEGFALFGNYNGATGTHIDVHDNKWLNGQMTGLNLSNCEGSVYNNIFDNIAYYGVLAANLSNLDIYQNSFTGIDNPDPLITTWGAGVRLYDDAPGAIVNIHNNTFDGNYNGITVRPDYDFSGTTANVYDNSITNSTLSNIRNEGTGTLMATCNWFGVTSSMAIAATVFGPVNYTPWRINGIDGDMGIQGFQPSGACVGTPVVITINAINPETCSSGPGSITTITSGGVAPFTYAWSNATTNADATGLISGMYTVTVTDDNGSVATASATVIALLVTNTTTNANFATVQAAVNAALPNETIQVCAATFNERVVIDKPLTLKGKTAAKNLYVLNGTGLGTGDGIHINDNVTGVTIQDLTVQNFSGTNGNSDAAIYANAGNNMLTITNVALLNNPSASGFYANGPISNVSITNSMVVNNGGTARGIVIWNGFKQNITITGNTLMNNTCCGIELQDGTASNVMVSNNTIDIGSGDNAIGLLGLNNSVGNNLIQSNIITGGGRFGIEIKNPNGGVTVSGNTVSLTMPNADLRDRAGIAIYRRDFTAGNPQGYTDIPNGVIISSNIISGYTQPSVEEGFGIVVEGVSHAVVNNTVSGCDVGIQIQGGGHANANYVPNNVGSGNQDVGNSPNYFGRGNAPYVCDISESGNMLSNTINRRMVTSEGVFTDPLGTSTIANQTAKEVTLDNGVTQRVYCTIQSAVNASLGNGLEMVKIASAATPTRYNEQVLVNKDVTLLGLGPTKPIVDFTGNPTGKATLFDVSADGVTIDGIQFNTNLTKLSSAIIASAPTLDNITVQNNMITPYQSTPGTYSGSFGDRNAISINYSGATNYRTATGGVNSIVVDNNMVSANVNGNILGDDAGDIGFRAATAVDEGAGTYTRNTFQTISHDLLVRFNSNGPITVGGSSLMANTFNGGGVTLAEHNASGGAVDISYNTFNGAVTGSVLRLQNNQQHKATSVHNNTFTNLRWGISLENYPDVTIESNSFTPLAAYTNFRHITVNTKSLSSNSSTIIQVPINGVINDNTFNSLSPTVGGTALAFYNHDSDNATLVANAFTVGAPGQANNFQKDFGYAIYLGDQTGPTLPAPVAFPEYNLGVSSNTNMTCWNLPINIEKNQFDVGAGLQLPQSMTGLQLSALEAVLYHQNDFPCLGELTFFQPIMVNAKVYLQGPYDATTPLPHLMGDQLRQIVVPPLFPQADPYTAFTPDIAPYWDAFVHMNHTTNEVISNPLTVLADNGPNSIVDWVFLELRNPLDITQVVATRSALLQRDGDIVDLDGTSEVLFPNTFKGNYYLMVRHRNHLAAMTASPIDFTNDAAFIDFSSPSTPTYGTTSLSARKFLEPGVYGLIAGNTNMKVSTSASFQVLYNNLNNDRQPILVKVGFATPLNVVAGYYLEDVTLDGQVKYNGDKNDRVLILSNVGLATPSAIITQQPPN